MVCAAGRCCRERQRHERFRQAGLVPNKLRVVVLEISELLVRTTVFYAQSLIEERFLSLCMFEKQGSYAARTFTGRRHHHGGATCLPFQVTPAPPTVANMTKAPSTISPPY